MADCPRLPSAGTRTQPSICSQSPPPAPTARPATTRRLWPGSPPCIPGMPRPSRVPGSLSPITHADQTLSSQHTSSDARCPQGKSSSNHRVASGSLPWATAPLLLPFPTQGGPTWGPGATYPKPEPPHCTGARHHTSAGLVLAPLGVGPHPPRPCQGPQHLLPDVALAAPACVRATNVLLLATIPVPVFLLLQTLEQQLVGEASQRGSRRSCRLPLTLQVDVTG